jgi:hypothetical protein
MTAGGVDGCGGSDRACAETTDGFAWLIASTATRTASRFQSLVALGQAAHRHERPSEWERAGEERVSKLVNVNGRPQSRQLHCASNDIGNPSLLMRAQTTTPRAS